MLFIWAVVLVAAITLYKNVPPFLKSLKLLRSWNEFEESNRRTLLRNLLPKSLGDEGIKHFDQDNFKKFIFLKYGTVAVVTASLIVFLIVRYMG